MHAYLIFAHKNLDQLPRLIDRLDSGGAAFFLHIDKATDTSPYERALAKLRALENVHFVERHRCPWSAFGLIEAQRSAMEAALAAGRFTHFMMLTGQDYPLRPAHEIDSFFNAHKDTSFIGYFFGNTKRRRKQLRMQRYKDWNMYFAGRHRRVSSELLNKVGINREIPGGLRPVKGWAEFTVTPEAAEYALRFYQQNPRYVRFWRHARHPDEYFWQTILLNSPLRERVANSTLRYTPFIRPGAAHTATFRKQDLEELKQKSSEYFFAKKFDVTWDPDILDLLDRDLLRITDS